MTGPKRRARNPLEVFRIWGCRAAEKTHGRAWAPIKKGTKRKSEEVDRRPNGAGKVGDISVKKEASPDPSQRKRFHRNSKAQTYSWRGEKR